MASLGHSERDRFERVYRRSQSPAMMAVERCVCGCDYGATSWADRKEVDQLAALLELAPGVRLLDIGAGSGWPALYMAKLSGCDLALTDMPLSGLRIAAERAEKDGLAGACWVVAADGAALPFGDARFDAVTHSDVLCCLEEKKTVLESCRRVVSPDGRMVFSVIYVKPDLSPEEHRHAIESGPPLVDAPMPYPEMLDATGWRILARKDLTQRFARAVSRKLDALDAQRDELVRLIGAQELEDQYKTLQARCGAATAGNLRRALFVAVPC